MTMAVAPALAIAKPRPKRCVVVKAIRQQLPNGKFTEAYSSVPGVDPNKVTADWVKKKGYKLICVY